ncbi:MAG TPA: N-acetylmuramic acid 6-phosphate etherase [Verrucomicrobiae bacterium]|nr:N-acetylmuramic acid 6-phosphate etherase [Verrucomicrobiae bacterium]
MRARRSSKPELKVHSTQLAPTERRNPHSMKLDRMSVRDAVTLMLSEEAKVTRALLRKRAWLVKAVNAVVRAFQTGGRLFYLGAGTSGRLGVLDASECPPTFRADPTMVQGIIAGGDVALRKSVEGAEDDAAAGAAEISKRRIKRNDVVVGIAASGTTPFVWGAIRAAKARNATTILVCFNPYLKIPAAWRPDLVIATDLGPEVLTGSTRLKAGTATKLVLNLLTTLAMVRVGKVMSNLMVDVRPTNEKLRRRAVRIVRELTGWNERRAERALRESDWVIREACRRPGS